MELILDNEIINVGLGTITYFLPSNVSNSLLINFTFDRGIYFTDITSTDIYTQYVYLSFIKKYILGILSDFIIIVFRKLNKIAPTQSSR